ncbi:Uncharacterised protein [Mycobacteroides abscessus subsp. abscessus]|nr:Uncharacterised protein [Mycobacteroides abscessus subsp. abscessus]
MICLTLVPWYPRTRSCSVIAVTRRSRVLLDIFPVDICSATVPD